MTTRQKRRSPLKRAIFPIVTAACLGYFGYHAFHGDYGIFAQIRLKQDTAELTDELAGLTARRTELEKRIALMKADNLDPDMLDERARSSLNMANPDEVIILKRWRD